MWHVSYLWNLYVQVSMFDSANDTDGATSTAQLYLPASTGNSW